jgi:hypothetical protein
MGGDQTGGQKRAASFQRCAGSHVEPEKWLLALVPPTVRAPGVSVGTMGCGRLGVIFGGILGVGALWSGGGDQLPKRWKPPNFLWGFQSETQSGLYGQLLNPFSAPPCGEASAQREDGPMTKRHHNWNCPHVAVYSVLAPPHPMTTVRDLSDRGQAEAVRFLEKSGAMNGKSLIDLRDALNDSETIAAAEKDPFQFERVLVATVVKGANWEPGDRMMWTRVFVQPINFSFAGYTVAGTDNETEKVTSVEATNTRKFDADIESTIPGMEGPKATVGPSNEHSIKTTSDITAQYEKLGIDIMPDFLRIIRESETGGDVVGNTTVSLTAVTDPVKIWKRFPTDGTRHDPKDDDVLLLVTAMHVDGDTQSQKSGDEAQAQAGAPLISVGGSSAPNDAPAPFDVLPQVPVPHCPLWARVWMLYEERRVDKGRESYDESKQAVTLLRDAEDREDVQIMSADEVSPAVWSIQKCDARNCDTENRTPLHAKISNGKGAWRNVVFTDYGLAVRFAHWLRIAKQETPQGSRYTFDYPNQSKESFNILRPFKKTTDECEPKDRPSEY